jgi:hypothetical protein
MSTIRLSFATSLALGIGALCLVVACSDDDDSGDCEPGGTGGCEEGMVCLEGADGEPACFCDTETNGGCEEGLDCYPVEGGDPACLCSVDGQTGCEDELACELVPGEGAACFEPISLGGRVFDLATDASIEGARVVARDANNAAVSGVAISDENGEYLLHVPNPRTPEGELLENPVMLRADATAYLTFPRPPRVAVPVDTSEASGDPPILKNSATDIGLIALPDGTGLGTVSGTVVADKPRGTLVVAGGSIDSGGGVTGIADFDGTYSVFNVSAGSVAVRGYKAGLQLDGATADVVAGEEVTGVDLVANEEPTVTVTGKVEIVNPGDGDDTSIILVVRETFMPTFASGDTPPGLRVGEIRGDFTIEHVPNGDYTVLAAFENDFLVRDPDTSIGGTDIVHITVSGGDVALDESFKITGSLDVVSPDKEEIVSGTPTFVWSDDSGEDHYEIVVFDAFGELVWERTDIPGVSGSATVDVPYEGPALTPGLLYQFRGTSIKNSGAPLARTEDLRGVFVYQ